LVKALYFYILFTYSIFFAVDRSERRRELVRIRCRNIEEGNKYWLDKECGIGIDCMKHYVKECPNWELPCRELLCSWFRELGKDKEKMCRVKMCQLLYNWFKELG